MKQIDFLPAQYHEVAAKQKSKLWRCSVVVLFGSTVAMTAVVQYVWRSDIRKQVAQVESLYSDALVRSQTYAKLQADYAEAQHDAELYTYLKHPWPRTQLLSQLSRPLPESITLGEIRLTQEPKELSPSASNLAKAAAPATDPATQSPVVPAEADLKRLRSENDEKLSVVYVSGLSQDATQLHQYVGQLSVAPLFIKAELKSLESDPTAALNHQELSKFSLRLVVRPGYGQPDGPTAPQILEEPATETAAVTVDSLTTPANRSTPSDAT